VTKTYLQWVAEHTPTAWWHDSADAVELDVALRRGAVGVTTNPVLISAAVKNAPESRRAAVQLALARDLSAEARAEALVEAVVRRTAERLAPRFDSSNGESAWVCAQVNPARAGDRTCMYLMAQRFHRWARNVAVKLPATAAGLDVLEDCVATGITVTATVSFTVAQVLAIAERHRRGSARARAQGIVPGKCFAVLMIGRLDDYLRDVAHDQASANPRAITVTESDICQAGLAVAKRSYALYRERQYDARLLVAALRGSYHLTELAGGSLVMSIHPTYQEPFVVQDFPREVRIDHPIAPAVVERLRQIPEFGRAYEPDGLAPAEFLTFGATQRTLSQFTELGWKALENFSPRTEHGHHC
jgi:transaldolase